MNLKPFRFPEGYIQDDNIHYEDKCHGSEISNYTFYFVNNDKVLEFKNLTETLIKLINAGKNFEVSIDTTKKNYENDPYLQTR